MRPDTRGQLAVTIAAVIVLGALAVGLQAARDRVPLPVSDDTAIYLSQRAAGRIVFTHRLLAADLYWIRSVQYFGGQSHLAKTAPQVPAARRAHSFDLLYPLLDITTTLDPRFNIAYRFGAIFLSEAYPTGPGRPDLAVALLEKGVKAAPERWEYWQDIGFVYYWNVHDYQKASEAFRRGADVAGAPWWMRSLAASMLVKGGDRTTSRLLWTQLYETANNEFARQAALTKLLQLKAMDDIEQLQAALDRGVLRGLPRDPAGVPYIVNNTRVDVSRESPLFPLPTEPGLRQAR